jgi:hypothetical protein
LPASKQGVASAVNDAAREIGAALGVAVLASAFTNSYRSDISKHLDGVSPQVAAESKEAPALALRAAHDLGDAGTALNDAARHAFVSGLRSAVLIAAGLMVVGAIFTWVHGPRGDELVGAEDEDLIGAIDFDDLVGVGVPTV